MPYADAMKDGVPVAKDRRGFQVYYPPCHICGESVSSWSYSSEKKYTCFDCKIIQSTLRPRKNQNGGFRV